MAEGYEVRSGVDRRAVYRGGRRADDPPTPIHQLTSKQRQIVEAIDAYVQATREPCPARLLARRMRIASTTMQEHLEALHRHGWLVTPGGPVTLAQRPTPDPGESL